MAAAEQAGFGALELEKYDEVQAPATQFGSIKSVDDLKPSDENSEKLVNELLKAYIDAQAAVFK